MPKVTVILTSYNKPRLVGEAIQSVLGQTFQDFELIVGDDNSNDQTRRTIARYLDDPRIVYLQTDIPEADRYQTCRYAAVINQGLKIAQGEYISYLCDDDIYYPRRLEVMAKYLDEHPEANIVYGAQRLKWKSGTFIPLKRVRPTVGVTWRAAGQVDHNSVMHRRICSDKVGGWDDDKKYWHSADAVFFDKLNKHWPFYPIEEVLDEHRFHATSVQSRKLLILVRSIRDNLGRLFRRTA